MRRADIIARLNDLAEQVIMLMDILEGDADLEDDGTAEDECDEDIVAVTLAQDRVVAKQVA